KATAEMGTGRVHAFAATVSEPVDAPAADELGEPARKVSCDDISGIACDDPAGDQPQMRQRFARPHQRRADPPLVIQQTEEILTPLANDNTASLQLGIRVEAVEFGGDLGLQVAGIGRDPHRSPVLLSPQAGWRDIAERLADPGTRFREDGSRTVGLAARG